MREWKRWLPAACAMILMALCLTFTASTAYAYSTGDDYPSKYKTAAKNSIIDKWNYYNRQCTSFVAWCLNSRNGVKFHNMYGGVNFGDAKTWYSAAKSIGITVNTTPAVGSVAVSTSGTWGHVAWVEAVSGNNVTIEEYNYNSNGNYNRRTVAKSKFTGYIHFKDITTTYTLDVNLTLDGAAQNKGLSGITFDVTVGGSKVGSQVQDYYASCTAGKNYTVNNINISGCYKLTGNSSYSGTMNSNQTVTIPVVTSHSYDSGAVTTAATCTTAGVKTYTCTKCGATKTESIPATGHSYSKTLVAATCIGNAYYVCQCSKCGDSYTEAATDAVQYSDWSDTKPSVSDNLIQSKTVYRYRDSKEQWVQTGSGTIQFAAYGNVFNAAAWPSGFNTSSSLYSTYNKTPKTAYNNGSTKVEVSNTRAGYIYWHWCYGTYTAGPINRKISSSKSNTYPSFHAFFSTEHYTLDSSANARKCANASVCKDTYWWLDERVPIYNNNWTSYTLQNSGVWSDWSAWQDAAVSATSTRQVETKTMYRQILADNYSATGHTYSGWTVKTKATCSTEGKRTRTCTLCGDVQTETISADSDAHVWDDGKTTNAATCLATGTKQYTCALCGKTKTAIIEMQSHSFNTSTVRATFSDDGSVTKKCSSCGTTQTTVIPKLESAELSYTKAVYSGSSLKPSVTVTDRQGNELTEGTDYTVTYHYYKSVGKGHATITFEGDYSGTSKCYYTISPKKAVISSLTVGTDKLTVKMSKVVSATGGTLYQVQYRKVGSTKWITAVTTTSQSKTLTKLTTGAKYEVRVRASKVVDGTSYYGAWSTVKTSAKIK